MLFRSAVVRTLTRPLPTEAHGVFQLVTALESAALILLFLVNWRRVSALVHWQIRVPYVALAATVVFAGAMAYAHFANLGILARQRSLLTPLLLTIPCLPEWQPVRRRTVEPVLAPARPVTPKNAGT